MITWQLTYKHLHWWGQTVLVYNQKEMHKSLFTKIVNSQIFLRRIWRKFLIQRGSCSAKIGNASEVICSLTATDDVNIDTLGWRKYWYAGRLDCRVSARTGHHVVSILWPCKTASLMSSFYFSLAARTMVWIEVHCIVLEGLVTRTQLNKSPGSRNMHNHTATSVEALALLGGGAERVVSETEVSWHFAEHLKVDFCLQWEAMLQEIGNTQEVEELIRAWTPLQEVAMNLMLPMLLPTDADLPALTFNNGNNDRIERRDRDFLQSPHCPRNCLQHVRSSGQGTIVCKSPATHQALIIWNVLCATWYVGTAQLLDLTEFKLHLL